MGVPESKIAEDGGLSAEASFRNYIAAFNRGDAAAYAAFYCDDVVLIISQHTILRGPQAIVQFYAGVKASTERTIRIVNVLAAGDLLAAELESEFLATSDLPDFAPQP